MRTLLFTLLALVGFAANSLLCRAALAHGGAHVDAATFTLVRLASGALVLALLLAVRRAPRQGGSWTSSAALFLYAAGFSLAYVRIGAGVGALILFGCVQLTMLAAGVSRGERPHALEWLGMALAFAGLAWLVAPGVSAPDPLGALLMAFAGVAWGVYSLRGRGARAPLAATADNFLRGVPFALALLAVSALVLERPHASGTGLTLAVASGALASGVGYSLWYAALPHLRAAQAAVVQLLVPVLAALGATLLLGEHASARLVGAGALVLAGVSLALGVRFRQRA